MLKSFKFCAINGKLNLVLLEYGEDTVSIEKITEAIKETGTEYINQDAIEQALNSGVFANIEVASPAPPGINGACWANIDEESGTVQIELYPPSESGQYVKETDIQREIQLTGCGNYLILKEAIQNNLAEHIKNRAITIFKAAERHDGELTVEIAEDRRTAYFTYLPPRGGNAPTLEEAIKILNNAGVVFGIDEKRLENTISDGNSVSKQRIAGAKETVSGIDASLEYLFDAFLQNVGPHIRENDTADYRDLSLFENVEQGTPLVKKIPATPGEDGTDVTGKPLNAEPGKDTPLPKGKNTCISDEDPNILRSSSIGIAKLQHGKVNVEDVLILTDIDFSTGNIDFNGNVLVKGIVNSGFYIKAEGDINCNDTVEGADLFAGGNILLKRGIKGMGKSRIEAGNNIMGRFIERCFVKAGNSVLVDEALIHSVTSAVDTVEVTNSKGSIFGGHIQAGNMVKAAFIGSEMAVKTEIEVGVTPHIHEELVHLNDEIKKKKPDHEKAMKNFLTLEGLRKKTGLPEEREELYQTLGTATKQLENEIEEISTRIAELEGELQACAEGRIEAVNTMFPGVMATIKNAKMHIRSPIHKAILVKDGPDVRVSVEIAENDGDEENKKSDL